jgi:hypothetical protein
MQRLIHLIQIVVLLAGLWPSTPPAAQAAVAVFNPKLSGDSLAVSEEDFQISPDGSRVVYRASDVAGSRRRLYSAPSDGSAPPALLSPVLMPGETVSQFKIAPDGQTVLFLIENLSTNKQELYKVPLLDGDVDKLNGPLPVFARVEQFMISPNGQYVVYRADIDADNSFDLFSVPLDGDAVLRINAALGNDRSIESDFAISPDSKRVVYRADLNSNNVVEVFTSSLSATGSTRLNDDLVLGGDVSSFQITPNSQSVLYIADQDANSHFDLYRVNFIDELAPASDLQAVGKSVKLNSPLAFQGSVKQFLITSDSKRVVYRADGEQFATNELYSVALLNGTPTKLNPALVTGGAIMADFQLSPDNAWVVYRADQETEGVDELYRVPTQGGVVQKINGLLAGAVDRFAISANSLHVVYRADQDLVGKKELYSALLAGGNPTKLNPPTVDNDSVRSYTISPDSNRVLYIMDADQLPFIDELYSVPVTGGTNSKLNGPIIDRGGVTDFRISSDSSRVVYRADQQSDNIFEFFAVYEAQPSATIAGATTPLDVGATNVTIKLSHAMLFTTVQVQMDALGGTALPNVDYNAPAQFVSFAPGEQNKQVPVTILANPDRDTTRSFNLILSETSTATIGTPGSVALTIAANNVIIPPGPSPEPLPGLPKTYLPLVAR